MSGRMVDVDGISPESALIEAASNVAYGDTPYDRVILICRWVATKEATLSEVVGALTQASRYLDDDCQDEEAAKAYVVLSKAIEVLR